MSREEFLNEAKPLVNDINKFLKKFYEDEELEIDFGSDPDLIQEKEEYSNFLNILSDSVNQVNYLKRDTKDLGYLFYDNSSKRYATNEGELHSGEVIEVLVEDVFLEADKWCSTRIEYSSQSEHSNHWYLVGLESFPLDNLKVRKRI